MLGFGKQGANAVLLGNKIVLAVRGLPLSTSAKSADFWTPYPLGVDVLYA